MTKGQSPAEESLTALIEDCEHFESCPSCGQTVVDLSTHQCPSETLRGVGNRESRERRATRDERDDDDLVGVYRRTQGNAYAYHELDEENVPRCPIRNPTKARKFEVLRRAEARAQGKAPCGHCRRADGNANH
jgi:hypothetical protein